MAVPPISSNQGTPPLTVTDKKVDGKIFESILKEADAKAAGVNGAGSPPAQKSAEQELADYVNMTPAQRLRADILKKLGITEEELAAMPPEQRKAVDAKITELMQQQEQQRQQAASPKKGRSVDLSV